MDSATFMSRFSDGNSVRLRKEPRHIACVRMFPGFCYAVLPKEEATHHSRCRQFWHAWPYRDDSLVKGSFFDVFHRAVCPRMLEAKGYKNRLVGRPSSMVTCLHRPGHVPSLTRSMSAAALTQVYTKPFRTFWCNRFLCRSTCCFRSRCAHCIPLYHNS